MATEQRSTTAGSSESPFTRPGFLVSSVLVAALVIVGVIVAVRVGGNTTTNAPPPSSTVPTIASSSASAAADPAASVCGLTGPARPGPLTSAPAGAWQYEGATAYPSSPEFGPGRTAAVGYRFCFQHSPSGAVFATANALAVPSDAAARQAWAEYFVSSGPNRTQLLAELNGEPSNDPTGIRVRTVGFKVLSYADSAARVDIVVEATGQAQTVLGSYVYELTWQDGDWKLNSDAPTPFNFSTVATTAGYIPWSA